MRLLCVILVSAAAACGAGKASGPARPTEPSGSGSQASNVEPKPGPGSNASQPRPAVENRCDKLIEHLVTLAVAERPAEQKISDDERKNIESQLRTSWGPKCNAMTERGYSCAVNAPTLAELDRCGG
jgi:hypothetical protein